MTVQENAESSQAGAQHPASEYLLQIDLLKGLAILFVIATHALPEKLRLMEYAPLYFGQAVPLFVVILGLNYGLSFARMGHHRLPDIFSTRYFVSRFDRFVFPFVLVFVLSLFVGFFLTRATGTVQIALAPRILIGYLPLVAIGPGNYFITLIFQFIFVFPVLYVLYQYRRTFTLVSCFAVNLAFQMIGPSFINPVLLKLCILNYLAFIGLGLWISSDLRLAAKRNRFILLGAAASAVYLFIWSNVLWRNIVPYFYPVGFWPSALGAFYTALLVLVGIQYLPRRSANRVVSGLAWTGRASYHIFLIQILYFAALSVFVTPWTLEAPATVLALVLVASYAICIAGGALLLFADYRLKVMGHRVLQRFLQTLQALRS